MKEKVMMFFIILILIAGLVMAERGIAVVSVTSTDVRPGETSEIKIVLENQGEEDIDNVAVALDLLSDQLPFAPVGSAAEKNIDRIKEDRKESVVFQLVSLPDAKPQIYKIPLKIRYDGNEESTVISIRVRSEPVLEVAIDESKIFKVGDTGEIIVRFVNKGLADIKFLSAEIITSGDYDVLSASSVYIGNIEPDDFETASFNIHLNRKIGFIPIKLEFRDINNQIFRRTEFLNINIFTEDEASRLGLVKTNNLPYIISGAIIIVILLLVFRFIRKKRRAKRLGI